MSENYKNKINKNTGENPKIDNPKHLSVTSFKSTTEDGSDKQKSTIREKLIRYGHYDKLQG